MRRADTFTKSLFKMRHLDEFVPAIHPLRPTRVKVNAALVKMGTFLWGVYEPDIKGGRLSLGGTPEHRA